MPGQKFCLAWFSINLWTSIIPHCKFCPNLDLLATQTATPWSVDHVVDLVDGGLFYNLVRSQQTCTSVETKQNCDFLIKALGTRITDGDIVQRTPHEAIQTIKVASLIWLHGKIHMCVCIYSLFSEKRNRPVISIHQIKRSYE